MFPLDLLNAALDPVDVVPDLLNLPLDTIIHYFPPRGYRMFVIFIHLQIQYIILFPSQHKKFIFCFSLLLLSIIWPIPMLHLSGTVWKRQWMNSLWSGSVAVKDNLCVEQLVMLFEMCAWGEPPRIWLKKHNNDVIFSFWANFLLWKMTKL